MDPLHLFIYVFISGFIYLFITRNQPQSSLHPTSLSLWNMLYIAMYFV